MKERRNVRERGDFDDGRCVAKSESIETEKRKEEHTTEGEKGPRLPAVQQGRRCVFIRRGCSDKTSMLRIFVSKEEMEKKGMCVAGDNPARRCNPKDRLVFNFEGKRAVYQGARLRARGQGVDGIWLGPLNRAEREI